MDDRKMRGHLNFKGTFFVINFSVIRPSRSVFLSVQGEAPADPAAGDGAARLAGMTACFA
jgi:hypothetical protein